MGSLTADFSAMLRNWPADDAALQAQCRLLLLDGLGVAAAGASERGPSLVASLAKEAGGLSQASVIGHRFKLPMVQAARVNGMAMHVLDYEPMWSPANHALSPLLPALLALAESLEASAGRPYGADLLRALAKGIEAQGRLRLASGQLEPRRLAMHPPGIAGPLAAALACADMLGLDIGETAMAVGIAASRSAGLLANVGSHTKALHCADAAAHGLEAALLAARGFTANEDALAGPRGWGTAFFGADFDSAPLLAPLGRGRALDPGPSWKLFPSQFATHFAITAALDAHRQIAARGGCGSIRRAELKVPVMPYIDRPLPQTGLEGKFSWQYTAAAALLDGKVDIATFTDARRGRADMEAMLSCLTLLADPAISGVFDHMHVEIAVELTDGGIVKARCDAPLGSWKNQAPTETVRAKAASLLGAAYGSAAAAMVMAAVDRPFDQLRVIDLLGATRPA